MILPGLMVDVRQRIENTQKKLERHPSHARNSRLKWLGVDSLLDAVDYDLLCTFLKHLCDILKGAE